MHRYYYGLDAVRFFSAFAVVLFHLCFYVWAAGHSTMDRTFANSASFEPLTPVGWWGWIGVEIFFVISGFVIANSANGATPFAFLRSRLLRLWPAVWVCATITLAMRLVTGEPFAGGLGGDYVRSLVLWPKGNWIDGAYWSLAVEIVFYALVFGLLLTRSFRHLPLLAWGLTLVSAAFLSVAAMEQFGVASPGAWFDAIVAQADFLPFRHGGFFAIGIWLWMLSNRALRASGWVGLGVATVFGLIEIEMRAWNLQTVEAVAAAGQLLIVPALVWLAAAAIILACTWRPERFTPRSEAARGRIKLAGKVTYPLYLVHSTVGAGLMRFMIEAGAPPYLALALAVAFVLFVATVVAVYAEPLARQPLRIMLDAMGKVAAPIKPLAALFRRSDAIPVNPG